MVRKGLGLELGLGLGLGLGFGKSLGYSWLPVSLSLKHIDTFVFIFQLLM